MVCLVSKTSFQEVLLNKTLSTSAPTHAVISFLIYTVFIMAPKTTKSRLDWLLFLSFASLCLSKQLLGSNDVVFDILQFCIRALNTERAYI